MSQLTKFRLIKDIKDNRKKNHLYKKTREEFEKFLKDIPKDDKEFIKVKACPCSLCKSK